MKRSIKVLQTVKTMSANTGSEYEKYTWLKNMKNKSDIIVTNSNTKYYKIEQSEKDKKMVKIEDAPTTAW